MPGGKIEITETETTRISEKSADSCTSQDECSKETSSCETPCYDAAKIAMWIIAIILVLLWTCALFSACSGWGNNDSYNNQNDGECNDKKNDCRDWSGFAVGFLVWLVVLVIFIAAVAACGWAAIIFFVILIIILGAAWWWSSSCGSSSYGSSSYRGNNKQDY